MLRHTGFDLLIEKNEDGYFSRVMDSPAGTAAAVFRLPVAVGELEAFARAASSPYRPDSHQFETARRTARELGTRLFDATFVGEVGAMLHRCMDLAYQQASRLRVRLALSEAPELVRLPWETLFNHLRDESMALSAHAPLSRYIELSHVVRPLRVPQPLRMLVVIADPPGYPPVEVQREWLALLDTLDVLGKQQQLIVERIARPTLFELQRRLREQPYHIVHFVGHALYNAQSAESFLVFEDEQGRGRLVSGTHLASMLRDHFSVRLMALHSCGAWQPLPREPFTHIAYNLVKGGLASAIALPYELTDRAALSFSYELYSRLATGEPVDVATAEARRTMLADTPGVEWCAPVLISRVPEGQLFELAPAGSTPHASSAAERYAAYHRPR
jgi:hypothetical protein